MVERLDDATRKKLLADHPDWSLEPDRDAIVRTFRFADFSEAFAFMTRVALLAEVQDHHPEWSNIYNRVTIALTTHDADGLSVRDARMAASIEALL
jgi:4a-hydroxytetrahydrobiopterin dehydratase